MLLPWHHTTARGITLRGQHTPVTGKPLLHFVHGTGFNGQVYWPMLRRLLPAVDIVMTDAQGHGGSDVGERFLGWEANAAMVHEALQHVRARFGDVPVIGMGHSFGSIITTLIAAREPALFSRLVLLDPLYLPPHLAFGAVWLQRLGLQDRAPMVQLARKRRTHWPSRAEAHAALHQRGVFRGWDDEAFAAYVQHALVQRDDGVHLLTPREVEAEVFGGYASGVWRAIRRIAVPCHAFHGEDTFPYVKAGVARACRVNRHITRSSLPGGHCFMQQHPARTAQAVLPCLQA